MKTDFYDPKYYVNREISWVQFDHRVLNEAKNKKVPLFERLKFMSIVSSNLDEFFMVRVASLIDMIHADYDKKDIAGMKPKKQLDALLEEIQLLVTEQYNAFNRSLLPALRDKAGLELIRHHEELEPSQENFVDKYFRETVYPVLTPMAVDSSRPFPLIRNKTLNIGAMVRKKGGDGDLEFATVQVPAVLDRLVLLPGKGSVQKAILLEEVIERNISKLFLHYDIVCAHPYRITRNGDFTIQEDEAEDLLKEIEKQVKKRQRGEAIRLEVEDSIDKRLLKFLRKELGIADNAVFKIDGPLDLTLCMKVYGVEGYNEFREKKHQPVPAPEFETTGSIFSVIRKGDVMLHHPYQSFKPVVDFIRQAAVDPKVLAIKQTLYRVSGNSPIIAALEQAAQNDKQVTVLVELKARFDEENNIEWAKQLEKSGVHVIYGLVGLKTHSKITLVVRKEDDGIRRYVHLGTGNYNDATAKLYTDIGLFTCDEKVGEDATAVFNMLSGYSEPEGWNDLILAPIWLKDRFLELISREARNARAGKKAHIIAKMNSLCDPDIIAALYAASSEGVKIDLIVRGICSLKVGIPGVSENITVRSIVGTFLEHSRIFYFENGGESEVYCGSADWMPRNLERRVEIVFPIKEKSLRDELCHILDVEMRDNIGASILQPNSCQYLKPDRRGKKNINSQEIFVAEACEKYEKAFPEPEENKRVFVPVMSGAVPEDPVKLAKTVKNSRVKSEGKDSQPKKTDGNSVHEKKAAGRKTAGKPAPGKKRTTGK
ncbi:MAG: RNA degradosome polyphosphate kinase [Lachnospiraceae bacterium]|nr:RNA degradosome polyphosphate kinase [Lachnospiraceae bacterium]